MHGLQHASVQHLHTCMSLVLIAMSSKRAQQQQWPLCRPACCAAFDPSAEAQVMDKHMRILALQHLETKFIKVGSWACCCCVPRPAQ